MKEKKEKTHGVSTTLSFPDDDDDDDDDDTTTSQRRYVGG